MNPFGFPNGRKSGRIIPKIIRGFDNIVKAGVNSVNKVRGRPAVF